MRVGKHGQGSDVSVSPHRAARVMAGLSQCLASAQVGRWLGGGMLAALAAAALVGLAYQVQPSVHITIGDETSDKGVVRDFYADERREDGFSFRWTRGTSTIVLPGWGPGPYRLTVDMAAPINPNPAVTVLVNGQPLRRVTLTGEFQPYAFDIPATLVPRGDMVVTFQSATFSAPGDRRSLGVALHAVVLEPLGGSPATPPPGPMGTGVALALLAYATLGLAGWGWRAALAGAAALATALTALLAGQRLFIVPVLSELIWIAGLALAVTVLLRLGLAGLARWPGWVLPAGERSWLLTIVAATLLVRLGATFHPQMDIIDLGFHVNRYTDVIQRGMLFLKVGSAEWGARETIYSPAVYLAMAPLNWLISDKHQMVRIFIALLETSRLLLVFELARWASSSGRAGLLAATLFVSLPMGVIVFSWGIASNLFGEWWATALLLVLAVGWQRLTQPAVAALAVGTATVALLTHPGVLLLTGTWLALLVVGLAGGLIWAHRRRQHDGQRTLRAEEPVRTGEQEQKTSFPGRTLLSSPGSPAAVLRHSPASSDPESGAREDRRRLMALVGVVALAMGLAFALFYRVEAATMLAQGASTVQQRMGGAPAATEQPRRWRVSGPVDDRSLGIQARYVTNWQEVPLAGLRGYAREAWAYYWGWPLLAAALGWWALGGTVQGRHLRRLALAWAAAAALFALAGLLLNLYVRYMLFLLPIVAVLAGVGLDWLTRHGRWGRALVALLMVVTVAGGFAFWYQRIVYFYH